VLDDEQQFVVVLRPRDRPLRREQRGQVEVSAVAHAIAEVGDDGCLDATGVALDGLLVVLGVGHGFSLAARFDHRTGADRPGSEASNSGAEACRGRNTRRAALKQGDTPRTLLNC
jgi:hypothetical protein